MVYPDYEVEKIKSFFIACDEMIEGRFILSDIKISKILKAIASSEVLYNTFAQVLNNFKFKNISLLIHFLKIKYNKCISNFYIASCLFTKIFILEFSNKAKAE